MKKLLFVINPKSGRKGSKKNLIDALEVFSKNNYFVEVYITKGKLDAYHYIKENGAKYDVVAVCGGDGTANEATNALMEIEKDIPLGYFPMGTMNDFGSNFGLTNDFKETANKICEGKTEEFDVGLFENRYFNYVAGFGAFCDVSYTTDAESKQTLGNLAYIIEGISKLPNLRPYHTKLDIDGEKIEMDILFGLIINGNRVAGLELVEKNDQSYRDGLFDVLLIEHTPKPLELINYLGMLNPNEKTKYIHRYKGSKIIIETDEPLSWTLDGEGFETDGKVEISNYNKELKIFC